MIQGIPIPASYSSTPLIHHDHHRARTRTQCAPSSQRQCSPSAIPPNPRGAPMSLTTSAGGEMRASLSPGEWRRIARDRSRKEGRMQCDGSTDAREKRGIRNKIQDTKTNKGSSAEMDDDHQRQARGKRRKTCERKGIEGRKVRQPAIHESVP
jgi:hypothetical protein